MGNGNNENDEKIDQIITFWGKQVWNEPSSPPDDQNKRLHRHQALALLLREAGFLPENIALKHINKILKITVPIDNGSPAARQMRGAAFWYLCTAFSENVSEPVKKSPVTIIRKAA